MINFDYPLKDALQELIWDFQNIGKEFVQDLQALEPDIENAFDEIEEKYPDEPLEDAIFKSMMDEINLSKNDK